MNNISGDILEKVVGPWIVQGNETVRVSLFVVSKKTPSLKKVDLANLNAEQRAEKLHRWAQDCRFVALIERGDTLYAHMNAKFVEQLNSQKDLSIDGKRVSVKALTDEQYAKLAIVGKAFEESVSPKKENQEEKDTKDSSNTASFEPRQYFAVSRLVSDKTFVDIFIARMENAPGQILLTALRRLNEARREEQKRQEEENLEKEEKYFDGKRREINRDIVKGEIKHEEIQHQNQKLDLVTESARR